MPPLEPFPILSSYLNDSRNLSSLSKAHWHRLHSSWPDQTLSKAHWHRLHSPWPDQTLNKKFIFIFIKPTGKMPSTRKFSHPRGAPAEILRVLGGVGCGWGAEGVAPAAGAGARLLNPHPHPTPPRTPPAPHPPRVSPTRAVP